MHESLSHKSIISRNRKIENVNKKARSTCGGNSCGPINYNLEFLSRFELFVSFDQVLEKNANDQLF